MSDNTPKLYIAGMGMITSVGANAAMTAASVSAGVSAYSISQYLNNVSKPITMAMVPDDALPEFVPELSTSEQINVPIGRMLLMASTALKESTVRYKGVKPLTLILAGPTSYPGQEIPFTHAFFDLLMTQSDIQIDRTSSRLISTGRTGMIEGIDMAFKYLSQGYSDYILVGGVDSHQDAHLLLHLDEQDRVKTEASFDSFVPGEGAAFLLLTNKSELAAPVGAHRVAIYAPGLAEESGHLSSAETYTGSGLADAMRQAINNGNERPVQTVYSSMNGENFWAKEFGVAMLRNKQAMKEDLNHIHPADCYGDIGAATGGALIGIAAFELAKSNAPSTHLVYCSSDQASRAAVCVNLES